MDYATFEQMTRAESKPSIATDWQVYPSECGVRIAYANSQPTRPERANFNLAEGKATISGVGLDATRKAYISLTYSERALDMVLRVSDVSALIDALVKVKQAMDA